jgi:pimeloyl-ACP methyl ester carboxylesterase
VTLALIGGHMWMGGLHPLGVLALTVLLFGHAMVLAAEFVLMAAINRRTAQPISPAMTIVQAWLLECTTAMRTFGWQQPFCSRAWPEQLAGSEGRRGVLLVHGFACNRGLWVPWLENLHNRGVPCIAVDLDPPWSPIDDHRQILEAAVARLEQSTGLAPVVLAHSMGGLAVRAWWQDTDPGRLHRLITVGSPHRGTWLARFGWGAGVRQMSMQSEWLADLCAREGSVRRSRLTCYYSDCDNIVFPASNATLDGAENKLIEGEPHLHMLFNGAIWADAMHWLGIDPKARPDGA